MIKLVYCLTRRDGLTLEAFQSYWRTQHAANVTSVRQAIGAIRYVQSHSCAPELNALLRDSRSLAPGYDGVTEIWWESVDALQAALADPAAADALQLLIDDESTFIDFARSCVFITEEHEVF